jgi:hypothetical protein
MIDGEKIRRYARYARFSTDDPSAKYLILTFWIIMIIAVFPYFINSTFGLALFSLLISLILITAVLSITGRSRYAILALILIVPALILSWTYFATGLKEIHILSTFLSMVVLTLVTFSILVEVLRSKSPIPNHIIWGAIAVYLLIGISFASLYHLTYLITSGSFYYGVDPSVVLSFSDFMYFSFVTLATLGYGDIIPITAQARSFAILEAITGAFYLAVLIAKIVSLTTGQQEQKKS